MKRYRDRVAALERLHAVQDVQRNALVPPDPPPPTLADAIAGLRAARTLLAMGELVVQPFDPMRSLRQYGRQIQHLCWVKDMGLAAGDPRWLPLEWLQWCLDAVQAHHGGPFCQSSVEALAVVDAALAELVVLHEAI